MAGTIELNKSDFRQVWDKIKQDYPFSVWAISWKTKEILGFTVRNHFDSNGKTYCFDFYDDHLELLFRLKYL